MYSTEMEDKLQAASKLDDWVQYSWAEFVSDEDYASLIAFFDKDNYYDSWEENFYDMKIVTRNLKKILKGKDIVRLVESAFFLGQLVGRAEGTLLYADDKN